MNVDLASKTVCVVDNGLFVDLAVTLAPAFGRVLYYSPWQQAFPRSNQRLVGTGLEGVERIDKLFKHLDEIDCFVFPDVLHSDLQEYLRKLGKPVWGSFVAERLELDRAESKRWLRDLGLPVGKYKVIRGLTSLRLHLQRSEDQFVKSDNRGDMETFHSPNYRTIEPRLDELEHILGAGKHLKQWVVEDPIPTEREVGYDGFTIDGRFPEKSLYGVETKDTGYIGHVVPIASLPREVAFVNHKLAPLFRSLGYRNFFSTEIRVSQDGQPYLIDPCCRVPSPPGELFQYLVSNLADVIWEGAHGRLVEPEYRYEWGAELILKSSWAEENWQAVDYPEDVGEHVKLHYRARVGDRDYVIPQAVQIPEIGAVVAGGKTPEEAIKRVVEIAKKIEGYDIQPPNEDALKKALDGMEG